MLTFLTDDANARDINDISEGIEEGENGPIACLLCESSYESGIRGGFAELCTVDDKAFSVDNESQMPKDKSRALLTGRSLAIQRTPYASFRYPGDRERMRQLLRTL